MSVEKLVFFQKDSVTGGNTTSCGCLSDRDINLKITDPKIKSARKVWQHHNYNDDNLSFEKFYDLSQKNCFYCNAKPSNSYTRIRKECSEEIQNNQKLNGEFVYNGLDRVDNNLKHSIENVVPCCIICNRLKLNHSFEKFTSIIKLIYKTNIYYKNEFIPKKYQEIILDKKVSTIANRIFKRSYSDGNLKFKDFYHISQMNCFYCKSNLANEWKVSSKHNTDHRSFIYNGLDRIDNNKPHNLDNVVPCCTTCNNAKINYSQEKFFTIIKTIYENLDLGNRYC